MLAIAPLTETVLSLAGQELAQNTLGQYFKVKCILDLWLYAHLIRLTDRYIRILL